MSRGSTRGQGVRSSYAPRLLVAGALAMLREHLRSSVRLFVSTAEDGSSPTAAASKPLCSGKFPA
jgi:hypothetical protein